MTDSRPEMSAQELVELYAMLGRDVALHADAAGALEAVTNVAVQAVPGAHYASITRGSGTTYTTVAPTDPIADLADGLQYETSSGPCLDAISQDTVILSGDIANDARWPKFGPEATQAAGVNSVLAVRMVFDEDDMIAALNIYSRAPDAFGPDSVTVASLLATHGALAVAHVIAREKSVNLQRALASNREIGMAMGVLMTTHKLTRDQAFDLLRIASQGTHRKLADVAREVADTGTLSLPPQRPQTRNSRPPSS
jgi:transcriptional regulator with GAF, ATPase, and Fis domain